MSPKAKKHEVPFKKLDAESQMERLQLRGKALRNKKLRGEIVKALFAHEHILHDVHRYIQTLGVDFKAIPKEVANEVEQHTGLLALEDAGEDSEGKGTPAKVKKSLGIIDDDPNHWVPHKYTKIANSSVAFIKNLLGQIEEISLSAAAVQCLVNKGTKDAKVATMAELLEFSTSFSREEPL
eukprot:12764819-Heterocapsa_arctica.AAC.1